MARTLRGTAAHAIQSSIRCAIYTRKSTDEGLDRDFNSLDNQREAAENYVRSQQGEGWEILADRYDDGGFTGGNMDRPALQRLLADIGVVVYKIDRLSRSLLDFSKLADFLETHHVSIVSVTQQLDTSTSMGRLTMNMLLSFAQFEREMVSDRTRDKMRAARRRGKWTGGTPRLGYDVAPEGRRLVVNKEEAEQVKAIFGLYAENPSLVSVSQELNRRGWRRKCWKTKKGRLHDSSPWDVANLRRMLIDPLYAGLMTLGVETFPGEHEAIIPKALFQKVQDHMKRNRRSGGVVVRKTHGALLGGLLRCTACDAAMIHSWTRRSGRLHRYYVCGKAQKRGWSTCPTKSAPAAEIETFVVDRIRDRFPQDLATPIWDVLLTPEKERILKHLIERIDFDGPDARCRGVMNHSIQTVTYEFRKSEPASVPVGRVPRVTRLLALAHRFDAMIRSGELRNWGEAARLAGVTRARMTQITRLLLLAPKIQEDILNLSNVTRGQDPITERALRVVVAHVDWQNQEALLGSPPTILNLVTTFRPLNVPLS